MSVGLYIRPEGGGKLINYQANLKAASYVGYYNPQLDQNGESRTYSNISESASLFIAPRQTAMVGQPNGSSVTVVKYCNRISVDGGSITAYYSGFNRFTDVGIRVMKYDAFQIIGSQEQGFGLFLRDSTNFFSITDSSLIGQCVYKVAVNINGTFQIPQDIPNISNSIVFASWNRSDRALYLDRNTMQIRVYTDSGGNTSWGGDCYVELVVMSSAPHIPHDGGLTLWSPTTRQVIFSSRLPPFIYKGIGVTLNSNPGVYSSPNGQVSRAMVPLCTIGAQRSDYPVGAFWNISHCGLRMFNNSVTAWRTAPAGGHSTNGGEFYNFSTPITLPVIDAADYF